MEQFQEHGNVACDVGDDAVGDNGIGDDAVGDDGIGDDGISDDEVSRNDVLKYNGLSIVFFQIFSFSDECDECDERGKRGKRGERGKCQIEKAFNAQKDIINLISSKVVIDNQVFLYSRNVSPIRKYNVKGFSFKVQLPDPCPEDLPGVGGYPSKTKEKERSVDISGEIQVEMSLFCRRTVSLTYRIVIDDNATEEEKKVGYVKSSGSLTTDQVISLISLLIDAEHWGVTEVVSKVDGIDELRDIREVQVKKETGEVNERYKKGEQHHSDEEFSYGTIAPDIDVSISNLCIGRGGDWNNNTETNLKTLEYDYMYARKTQPNHTRFKEVLKRYKEYILKIRDSSGCPRNAGKGTIQQEIANRIGIGVLGKYNGLRSANASDRIALRLEKDDSTYAYVDIWESLLYNGKTINKGEEETTISNIVNKHKRELVGLMSLYPTEWLYRTNDSYDDVCGRNIAIDTDDLVLANQKVCVVIGTYGIRGDGAATNWVAHLSKIRKVFHVSWPEYLLILEMSLIKKHIVKYADSILMDSSLSKKAFQNTTKSIGENAKLHLDIMKLLSHLDAVKYLRYVSHKIMFDKTQERLKIEEERGKLAKSMKRIDDALKNIGDLKSLTQGKLLNTIMIVISFSSLFQLLFLDVSIPFLLDYVGVGASNTVAILMIEFGMLMIIFSPIALLVYYIYTKKKR